MKNTSNIDAYIRVRLVFHWQDSKGNVVARNMTPPEFTCYTESTDKWIQKGEYTYYYKTPVAPGDFTADLLKTKITMNPVVVEETIVGNQKVSYYYYPVVEVLAEAIQSKPTDAVESSWNVTVGSDGKITNVS